ncbi:trypsin-like serine peptidase [Cellulosimicrobium cellulans]|uniref:trypsin-like serine peptidase n=1 Tax=Cellulosimicrobium cellulans TaxID=1710 RepID=UPI0036E99A47
MPGTRKSTSRKPARREVPETPDTVDALYPPLPERIPLTLESIAGDEPTYAEMLESICGATDDSQPVEQYDGTLGVTQAYVSAHQKQAVQVQWNTGLGGVFTNPGNVDGVRWGSATLIGPDLVLTCGHLFDQSADGWVLPRQNGSMQVVTPQQIATSMHINVLFQVDASGVLRTEVSFPIVALVEYRLGGLDMAIVRVGGNPGSTYGFTAVATANPAVGDMLAIIGHPAGMPKRVEAGPATVVTTNQIRYDDIDTLGGNSGSGILGPAGELVGVHTNGGCNAAGTGSNFGTAIVGIRAVSPTLQALPQGARTATADDGFTSLAQDVIATVKAADQVGTLRAADTARAVDVLTIRQADSHTVADQIGTSFLRDQGGTPRALDSIFQADTRFAADNPVATGFAGDACTGPGDTFQEGIFDPGDLFDPVVNPAIGRLVQAGALAGARPFVQGAESLVDEEDAGEPVDVVGALVEAVAEARATLEAVEAALTQLQAGQ